MGQINKSVCSWHAFPDKSNVCELGRELPEWSTFQVLRSKVGSKPYQQTLDKAGKACQGQTLAYYGNTQITVVKSFIVQAPG
jgi:hypothetical protein